MEFRGEQLEGLTLHDIRRGPGEDRYVWIPFQPSAEFRESWWSDVPYMADVPHYVPALLDGTEVARVELDHGFEGSDHLGVPTLGTSALEIQLIEVAQRYRRQGVGAAVINRLASRHPERRLLAMSEDADEFWASLGWARYDHPEGPQFYRPLFLAPE